MKSYSDKKEELVQWLLSEPNQVYLDKVAAIKQEAEDEWQRNFDEEVKNGYTLEEFRKEMHKRIKAYPWKK